MMFLVCFHDSRWLELSGLSSFLKDSILSEEGDEVKTGKDSVAIDHKSAAENSFIVNSLSEINIDDIPSSTEKPVEKPVLKSHISFNDFLKMQEPEKSPTKLQKLSSPKPAARIGKPSLPSRGKKSDIKAPNSSRKTQSAGSSRKSNDEFNAASFQLEIDSLNALVKNQRTEIMALKSDVSSKDKEIVNLKSDVALLEKMREEKYSRMKTPATSDLPQDIQKTIDEQENLLKGVCFYLKLMLVSN